MAGIRFALLPLLLVVVGVCCAQQQEEEEQQDDAEATDGGSEKQRGPNSKLALLVEVGRYASRSGCALNKRHLSI